MNHAHSPRKTQIYPLLFLLLAIALGVYYSASQGTELLNLQGLPLLGKFFQASLHPDLSGEFLQLTIEATLTTFAYAVCGSSFSLGLGFILGILSSSIWWQVHCPHWRWRRPIRLGLRGFLAAIRSVHEAIWGLFFLSIWGLDPLTAIAAITLPFSAIVAKVFAEILEEAPHQPLMALVNAGVPTSNAFIYGLLPQAGLNLLSYNFYRFECALRSATILGIIGAGGLGFQIFLSLQSLRYEQLWTLFYALFFLCGLVDLASARLRRYFGCASRLNLNVAPKEINTRRQIGYSGQVKRSSQKISLFQVCILVFGLICLIGACLAYLQPDWALIESARSAQLLQDIISQSFSLNFQDIALVNLLNLSMQTLVMSFLAIIIASVGATILSFAVARSIFLPGGILSPNRRQTSPLSRWRANGLFIGSRAFLLIFRAVPSPVWALVILFITFPGILPGAIALGIHNMGILGRLMAEGIENLDDSPIQSLKAQGTPTLSLFLYAILPLSLPQFLAYCLYRWEVCLRESVIVGLVGAGGLGRLLSEQVSSFDYSGIVLTLVCFILLTVLVDGISQRLRKWLR